MWSVRIVGIIGIALNLSFNLRAAEVPQAVAAALPVGGVMSLELPTSPEARLHSILVTISQPGHLDPTAKLTAQVEWRGNGVPAPISKELHCGDPDILWTIRQSAGVAVKVSVVREPQSGGPRPNPAAVEIRSHDLGPADEATGTRSTDDRVAFEAEPNDSPETANPLTLGRTVYGLADDRSYLPRGAQPTDAERTGGIDWFTFQNDTDSPKLVYFALDFVDRDIPPDVRVYQKDKTGKLLEYTKGIDPQSLQRERPPRLGANKFTTRVLTRGTYFVSVDACQPDYQLRTKVFDVPPYLTAEQATKATPDELAVAARRAIRSAMDFQLLAGDSWHANTPRHGHTLDRVSNFHHETSTCIACHPTHFTTQSALAALKSGYKVEQPFALQFLTERLANNPVPFFGYPNAVWARMIPAPANVLGRLSTMVMDFEDLTASPHRDNTHRAIGEFLKLYYDGRTEIPPDESNGNNPVSRYKVASDAWRQLDEIAKRTQNSRFAETRDLVARLLPTGEPANTRDLAAQTIGLCTIDPNRKTLGPQIEANVKRLLELQRPDGHWSVKFDPKYPITEMQTGESLYALSLAGLPVDHPAIRRGVVALLTRQKEFGGWFDINPYEQFRTPFRETQWALISLAQLFPNPTKLQSKGWNGPLGNEPAAIRQKADAATLVRDLEKFWDDAEDRIDLKMALIGLIDDPRPLVRYAACRAAGRVAGERAISLLLRHLGDESKVVRRAAAEALRMMGNRLEGDRRPRESDGQKLLVAGMLAAIEIPDDRIRRGATRVFAAHFREVSQELPLADALLARIDDPDPVVAMQAIKGLWRWWYWQSDDRLRNRIEDRLISALGEPRHPWVRRNLTEALYILGDENIRYLYKNWVPSLASEEARDRATKAQHATADRLGMKFAVALEGDNPTMREGILLAMTEFGERPAVTSGRVGNDVEPMLFHGEAAQRVASALIKQMDDPDPTIRRLALGALITVRDLKTSEIRRAVARRLGDTDADPRGWAVTMSREFPIEPTIASGKADSDSLALVDDLLASKTSEAHVKAMEILGRIGAGGGTELGAKVMARTATTETPEVRAAAFNALRAFPRIWEQPDAKRMVLNALSDEAPAVRVAAIRLALAPKSRVSEKMLRQALDDPSSVHRAALLDRMIAEKGLRADLRLLGVVANALADENGGVREKALAVIQASPSLVGNAAIESGLRDLAEKPVSGKGDNERQRGIASALLASRGRSSAGDSADHRLDLAYFEAKVLPIFNKIGDDGQNCIGCHRSHTVLTMVAPGKNGRWSPEAVRANYRAALRVVDLARPAESLIVNKPTWEAAEEAEAQNDPTIKAHSGGIRFGKSSSEHQAILDWINGAKLSTTKSAAK
jgi:HEAT repeat protein